MKVMMDEEAIQLAKKWFPKDKLEKLMPNIDAMKTKNGKDILVKVYGDLKSHT